MEKRIISKAWTWSLGILFFASKACAERKCLVSVRSLEPHDEKTFSDQGSEQLLECAKEPVTCPNGVCSWNHSETCFCRLSCSGIKSACFANDSSEALIEHSRASSLDVPRVSCIAADLRRTGVFRKYAAVSSCRHDWPKDGARRYCEADDETNNSTSKSTAELVTSRSSGVTYKNKQCAACNRDTKTLIDWKSVYSEGKLLKLNSLYAAYLKFMPPQCDGQSNVSDVRAKWSSGASMFACRHVFDKPRNSSSHETRAAKAKNFCHICLYTVMFNVECNSSTESSDVEEYEDEGDLSVLINTSYANTYQILRKFSEKTDSITGFISAFFVLLKVIVYALNRSPPCFISRCTLCYALTLLACHVVGYVSLWANLTYEVYEVLFLLLLYLVQCSFLWTLIVSFDIWKAVTASKRTFRSTKTLVIYGAFAWSTPCTLFALIYLQQCGLGNFTCFLGFIGSRPFQMTTVATPLVAFGVELCFYFHVVVHVRKCREASHEIEKQRTAGSPSRLLLFVKLAFVMCATGVFRMVISLPFLAPSIGMKPLGLVVYRAVYIMSEILGGVPGTYVFFAFNDHVRLWRIISRTRDRCPCCLRSKSRQFLVVDKFDKHTVHFRTPVSRGKCTTTIRDEKC